MDPTLHLLGRPRWRRVDGSELALGPQRRLQVLAVLGVHAGWVSRDELASLFWSDRLPTAARGNLRKVLHELRLLGVTGVEEDGNGLRWCPDSDIARFRAACERHEWPSAARLGCGALLHGVDDTRAGSAFATWLADARAAHMRQWRDAAWAAMAGADARVALELARSLLAADPLDEQAVAAAWRSGHALGQATEARRLWDEHRRQLAETVQAPPARWLIDLVERAPGSQDDEPEHDALIGRRSEIARLLALLDAHRLVTVLGPGGIGKSHLARAAMRRRAPHHAQGAVQVPLDDLDTPGALPARIAQSLGERLPAEAEASRSLERLLAGRSILLVLDGFEAVVDAAEMLPPLLDAVPGLRLLVTSRERLDVRGEWVLPLDGLEPDDAVSLLERRCSAIGPARSAALPPAVAARVGRVVGGNPLALELVASWTRVIELPDLVVELEQNLGLLGDRLDGVFERSWALLTAAERQAFARLGVFRGGFARDAAQAVAGVSLPMLRALVDKSMLQVDGRGRFGLHAVLAGQAQVRLAALADAATLADAHSRWYLSRPWNGPDATADDHPNLVAAWNRAAARGDAAAVDAALANVPMRFIVESRLAEGVALLDDAARRLGTDTPAGAHARAHQAWMLLWLERYDEAGAIAEAAWRIVRPAGHVHGMLMALRTLGHLARRRAELEASASHFARALDLALHHHLRREQVMLRDALAMTLNLQGRYAEARQQLDLAQALNDAIGDDSQRMYNAFNRSQSHSMAGEAAQALPWAEAAVAAARRIGYGFFVPYATTELGLVLLMLGRHDAAQAEWDAALQAARRTGDRAVRAWIHESRARAALARGQLVAAREAVHASLAELQGSGNRWAARTLRPVAIAAWRDAPDGRVAVLGALDRISG